MNDILKTFSSLSYDGDGTDTTETQRDATDDITVRSSLVAPLKTAAATSMTPGTTSESAPKKLYKRPCPDITSPARRLSSQQSLSPTNSVGSSSSATRHTKQAVVRALAAVRRNKMMNSPTNSMSVASPSALDSLGLPSLHESRNDRERRRSATNSLSGDNTNNSSLLNTKTACCEDGAEWEVSLGPSFERRNSAGHGEEKKIDLSPSSTLTSGDWSSTVEKALQPLSQETLERKTEQIILEAKMQTTRWRSANNYSPAFSLEDPRRRAIIQEALDRAAAKSKAAAADAVSVGAGITQSSSSGNQIETAELSELKIPAEVPDLIISSRYQSPMHSRSESFEDSMPSQQPLSSPSVARGELRPSHSMDGRPPLSPLTPASAISQDEFGREALKQSMAASPSRCFSPAESAGSIDDYETAVARLPNKLVRQGSDSPHEKVLRRIDGIVGSPGVPTSPPSPVSSVAPPTTTLQFVEDESSIISGSAQPTKPTGQEDLRAGAEQTQQSGKKAKRVKMVVIQDMEPQKDSEEASYGSWFNFLWGGASNSDRDPNDTQHDGANYDESISPFSCGRQRIPLHDELPVMASSLVRVAGPENIEGYAEAVHAQEQFIDPRMPAWVDNQFAAREYLPQDGTYQLGESRTVIVHELMRGNWTWCTAWSPDGKRLAIGTENHHLAIVDTYSSSIWRIKHDKKVTGLESRSADTTHSIRSIAWGMQFIAIGGVGNSVSILAPTEPYPVLHIIQQLGFVGSLDWLKGTNTLLIGSRNGTATVVKIWAKEIHDSAHAVEPHKDIQSTIVHTINRQQAWVNAAKFSPGGSALAVGDSKGILGVHSYAENPGSPVAISNIANFKLEDSILDIDWSPDGRWLYAGGEDFVVTVIDTQFWEAVHRIKRDRWVQFISSSRGGSHVAIGGVSSEVSILDVDRGWDTAVKVSLKGLVPLSAKWHPHDQYLVLTGQDNSIFAVEMTNARYVSGHFLRSVSPILAIEFSPDGRMAAIGNEAGVVTIFKLSGTTFITCYELVLDGDGSLSIEWSSNGAYLAVVAGSKAVIVARSSSLPGTAPPNATGFHVAQVIRDFGLIQDVAISPTSRYLAISGFNHTRILDATSNFKCILDVETSGTTLANSWSPDGAWFATVGKNQNLLIYDTSTENVSKWRVIFTVQTKQPALTLAWGPAMLGGLQYCAYGGEDKKIYIMEIRTKERTWETVLGIPRESVIHDLDWNAEGLVAAAIGNGTVTVMDLSYLQSGWAVNEMDYNWQRQALTCFTEIRRNKGKNTMKCVRWIPSAPGSDSLLAVGGTDGEVEIIDLTDRQRCSGFNTVTSTT